MDRTINLTIDRDNNLYTYLESKFSQNIASKVIREGEIKLNGEKLDFNSFSLSFVKNNVNLSKGDKLELFLKEFLRDNYIAKDMGLKTLFEDEDYLLVYKPSGVSCMPTVKYYEDNIFCGLKFLGYASGMRIVTRLDRQTCGVVVIAKNVFAHCLMQKEKCVEKLYLALASGTVEAPQIINKSILKLPSQKAQISKNGKVAVTEILSSQKINENSLVKIKLLTGRTHQIRVHLASIGHPLYGDNVYGNYQGEYNGEFKLFCYKVSFTNKLSLKKMEVDLENFATNYMLTIE